MLCNVDGTPVLKSKIAQQAIRNFIAVDLHKVISAYK